MECLFIDILTRELTNENLMSVFGTKIKLCLYNNKLAIYEHGIVSLETSSLLKSTENLLEGMFNQEIVYLVDFVGELRETFLF